MKYLCIIFVLIIGALSQSEISRRQASDSDLKKIKLLNYLANLIPQEYLHLGGRQHIAKYKHILGDEWWNWNYGEWRSHWLENAGYNYFKKDPTNPVPPSKRYTYDKQRGRFIPLETGVAVEDLVLPSEMTQGLRCRGEIIGYNTESCELCYCTTSQYAQCYNIKCNQVPHHSMPQCEGDGQYQIGCKVCSCWYGQSVCDKKDCGLYIGPLSFNPTAWRTPVDQKQTKSVVKIRTDIIKGWCDGSIQWYQDVPRCSKCKCTHGNVACYRDTCYASLKNMNTCEGDGRMRRNCNTCICAGGILHCTTHSCG